jgi:hypothetical protein
MSGCRALVQCREVLTATLDELAREVSTPGTRLNQLVTGAVGR